MPRQKSIPPRSLESYYAEPTKEITLEHLHELKEYFFSIMDDMAVLQATLKKSTPIEVRVIVSDIERLLTKTCFINFSYEYSKEKYWLILENIGKCIRVCSKIIDNYESFSKGLRMQYLTQIFDCLDVALGATIELIEELENSKTQCKRIS